MQIFNLHRSVNSKKHHFSNTYQQSHLSMLLGLDDHLLSVECFYIISLTDKDCKRTSSGVDYRGNLTKTKTESKTCIGPCRNSNDYGYLTCEVKSEKENVTLTADCDIPFCGKCHYHCKFCHMCGLTR